MLTGGGSLLLGARETAERIIGAKTRLGRPAALAGAPEAATAPQFSVAVGVLQIAARDRSAVRRAASRTRLAVGQTFGKGTVQTIQPLNHGELKLTLAKFYRVSGQSTQHQGVVPDIRYPALVDTSEIGESSLPAAMPWDRIDAVIGKAQDPLQPFISELEARHAQRTARDPEFLYIRERLALSQELANARTVSLNEDKRRAWQDSVEKRRLDLENQLRSARGEEPLAKLDEEDNSEAKEDQDLPPEKDAFLTESGHVLLDYLGLRTAMAAHGQPGAR